MITLNNTTVSLEDPRGLLPTQTVEPFSLSIGDRKRLVIEYEFDRVLDGCNFWFVPGLFIGSTSAVYASTPSKPTAYFYVQITASTADSTEIPAVYAGLETQLNKECVFELSADRMTLSIKLTFDATADTKDWLRNIPLDNGARWLRNAFDNASELSNTGSSVYGGGKYVGTYLYVEYPEPETALFEYESDGTTAYIRRNDGGSFLADGITGVGTYTAFVRAGSYITVATGSSATVGHDEISFTGGTILASTGGPLPCFYYNVTVGTNIYQSSNYRPVPTATLKAAYHTYRQADGLFYNASFGSNPALALERSASFVEDLSTELGTTATFSIVASSVPTNCIFWLIRVNDIGNDADFIADYEAVEIAGSVPALVSGRYESSAVIANTSVVKAGVYRILAIFYDGSTASSHISGELLVRQIPETLAVPDIASTITNYSLELETDAVEEAAVYERIQLEIAIDKASYDANNVQGGDFDSNINYIKLSYDGVSSQVNSSNGFVGSIGILDSATDLVAFATVRMKDSWEGLTIVFTWEIGFTTEPTQIRFRQQVAVGLFENNKPSPDTFDTIVLKDPDDDTAIANFYAYGKQYVKVEAETLTPSSYSQVAGFLDDGVFAEEDAGAGLLPALDSPYIEGLLPVIAGVGVFLVPFTQLTSGGQVAFLAFVEYQLELTTTGSDIQLWFGGALGMEVFMSFGATEVAVTENAWWYYDFGVAATRTLKFRIIGPALLDTLKISRSDQSGNSIEGVLDLSKLIGLQTLEAQNNDISSVVFGTFVQQSGILAELHNNAIDSNEALQQLIDDNEGAVASNRIVSLYGNTPADEDSVALVQELEAIGFDIELAYFHIEV